MLFFCTEPVTLAQTRLPASKKLTTYIKIKTHYLYKTATIRNNLTLDVHTGSKTKLCGGKTSVWLYKIKKSAKNLNQAEVARALVKRCAHFPFEKSSATVDRHLEEII